MTLPVDRALRSIFSKAQRPRRLQKFPLVFHTFRE